jgi:hypothetical protein
MYPAALIAIGDEVSIRLPAGGAWVVVQVTWLSEHGVWFKDPTNRGFSRHLGWPMVDLTVIKEGPR